MKIPQDDNNARLQLIEAKPAVTRLEDTTISTSTQIDVTAGATFIRFFATGADVWLKWGTTAVTNSNFDEILPQSQIIDVKIPVNATTNTLYTACTVIQRAATAAIVAIQK